jgi:hypothetical protein
MPTEPARRSATVLGLVAAHEQGRIAFQDLLEQQAVRRQVLGGELGVERDLLQIEGVALSVEVEPQRDGGIGEGRKRSTFGRSRSSNGS